MKRINFGLFYNVYNLDKNFVLKKRTSNFHKFLCFLKWGQIKNLNKKSIKKYNKTFENSINFVKENSVKINNSLVIPKTIFLDNFKLKQEKVVILKQKFVELTFQESCKIIDDYINLIFKMFGLGFCEITFNLTIDFGIDKNSNLVLIGFSEISTNYEQILEIIQNKKWEKQFSYRFGFKDKKLKKYFKQKMQENITQENFKKMFKKNIKSNKKSN